MIWLEYWKLAADPFAEPAPAMVALPGHVEVVARLVHAIEGGDRRATLAAGPGLGKSTALAQALAETRDPSRRVARVVGPVDGLALWAGLAAGLGVRSPRPVDRAGAWRALVDGLRMGRALGRKAVLVVEDAQALTGLRDWQDLDRLDGLDLDGLGGPTLIRVGRPPGVEGALGLTSEPGEVALRLCPLARSDVEQYLAARLLQAGRTEPTFTPRAITRLQALSLGVPRALNRLARLALMAGALKRLEILPESLVEAVAGECVPVGSE